MTESVIIAVNDPHILYLLQRYAEESGYQPVNAAQSKDVLNLLDRQPSPALLILDVEFSEVTSQKTPLGLKAAARNHHVPIVLYSCLEEPSDDWDDGIAARLPRAVMYDDFVGALRRAGLRVQHVRRA